jgi:hypothetical protein
MNAAPQGHRVKLHESFFGLFGGPIAWFLQFCGDYALSSEACFRDGERLAAPVPALQWTLLAMISWMAAAVAIALLSLLVSWRSYRRTYDEAPGKTAHLAEACMARTRFLSLWGMLLGGTFAVAIAMTGVAFLTLPRCAG